MIMRLNKKCFKFHERTNEPITSETALKCIQSGLKQLGFDADGRTNLRSVSFCQITAPPERLEGAMSGLSAVAIRPAKLDRSPCGTGCSARMAVLHARGLMKPGDGMSHASVIGSVFDGRIVAEARLGEREGIIPAVRGSAWITGLHQYLVDPSDPFPEGYLVADTWGVSGADTQA